MLQRDFFFKLATNDRSDKMFLLTSKFLPQGVVSTFPGAIYMYKIMKNVWLQWDFLELVANDRNDKRFLLTSKFCPLGLSALNPRLYTFIKSWKDVFKSEIEEICWKLVTNDQSDEAFLLTSKLNGLSVQNCPQGLSPLALGLYMHIWNKTKYQINNEAKWVFLELVQNDENNNSFKMLPELVPSGRMPIPWGFFSNDDSGLTLTIFMTGSNLFPAASAWMAAYTALCAHVFPSLF